MNSSYEHIIKEQQGIILLFTTFVLVATIGFTALVVDLGNARYRKDINQFAVDAAAQASAKLLPGSNNVVFGEAQAIAGVNNIDVSNIQSMNCGVWNNANQTFIACESGCGTCLCTHCNEPVVNAIKVDASEQVRTFFGHLLNVDTITPSVSAVAIAPSSGNCVRPFGVDSGALDGINVGDYFTIGNNSPGNWGKLNVGGNMSSGKNFEAAMLNNVCDDVESDDDVLTGTGFGGPIDKIFNLIDTYDLGDDMTFIIIKEDEFPNGRSGNVTVDKFFRVEFISQSGSGSSWSAVFKLLEYDSTPDVGISPISSILVQ